jgi:UDPglucose 6-dehydrogenase
MEICVIGTGYVGLVTGAAFADLGNRVICVDKVEEKIRDLRAGKMPIYEPGLEEMVIRNMADGRLAFATSIADAVRASEVVFIAVGTPPAANGETDLSQVEECAVEIGRAMNGYKVIVNKSTVPVGTGDFVRQVVEANRRELHEFDVVSNPEFLREGNAIHDTFFPDRIVIGAPSPNVAMKILELYAPLERPMIITDVRSAEVIKYASNAFLATKISFMNIVADLCEASGADIMQVTKGMGADQRIGPHFLRVGLGYGGSCFGKDASSFVRTADRLGVDFSILKAVIAVNEQRPVRFVDRMRETLGSLEGKTVAVLGLAFKPNTDDMRDAMSVEVIRLLLAQGASVRAYDPVAMENARKIMPDIEYAGSPYEALEGADAAAIVTEWREFLFLDLERARMLMRAPYVFDGRNIYEPQKMAQLGFHYCGIGRNSNNMHWGGSAAHVAGERRRMAR